MAFRDEDLEWVLSTDPLTNIEFDIDLCVELLSWMATRVLEDRDVEPAPNVEAMRQALVVAAKLFEDVDVWMRAGRNLPARWRGGNSHPGKHGPL